MTTETIIDTRPLSIPHNARYALLAHTVDRLASVKAQIAALRQHEDELKQILIDSGESAVDGTHHRATISDTAGKECIDWRSIAERFNPSRQLIRAHTTQGERFFQIRVFGRKTSV